MDLSHLPYHSSRENSPINLYFALLHAGEVQLPVGDENCAAMCSADTNLKQGCESAENLLTTMLESQGESGEAGPTSNRPAARSPSPASTSPPSPSLASVVASEMPSTPAAHREKYHHGPASRAPLSTVSVNAASSVVNSAHTNSKPPRPATSNSTATTSVFAPGAPEGKQRAKWTLRGTVICLTEYCAIRIDNNTQGGFNAVHTGRVVAALERAGERSYTPQQVIQKWHREKATYKENQTLRSVSGLGWSDSTRRVTGDPLTYTPVLQSFDGPHTLSSPEDEAELRLQHERLCYMLFSEDAATGQWAASNAAPSTANVPPPADEHSEENTHVRESVHVPTNAATSDIAPDRIRKAPNERGSSSMSTPPPQVRPNHMMPFGTNGDVKMLHSNIPL